MEIKREQGTSVGVAYTEIEIKDTFGDTLFIELDDNGDVFIGDVSTNVSSEVRRKVDYAFDKSHAAIFREIAEHLERS